MSMKHDVSEPTSYPRDPYRLTAAEMKPEYDDDDLWGQYLYKKHTDLGQHSVSSEVAATLSTRDLEAILCFTFVTTVDFENDEIAGDTIKNCSHELVLREKK